MILRLMLGVFAGCSLAPSLSSPVEMFCLDLYVHVGTIQPRQLSSLLVEHCLECVVGSNPTESANVCLRSDCFGPVVSCLSFYCVVLPCVALPFSASLGSLCSCINDSY